MSSDNSSYSKSLYDKIMDRICDVCILITGCCLVTLTTTFGWLVFGRYVLNDTPTWVEQLSLLLIMFIGFLGAAVGIHRHSHLGVTVFRDISPRPVQKTFELLSYIIMLFFGIAMAINSYDLVIFKWGSDIPLLAIPGWLFGSESAYVAIPEGVRAIPITVAGGLIFLFSIGHLIHFFKGIDSVSIAQDK